MIYDDSRETQSIYCEKPSSMKVLVLSQYYPPEVGATQTRVHHFSSRLAAAGHDVSVVAEMPNHPKGVVFEGYRGKLVARGRDDLVRVWVYTSPRKSLARRLAFYGTYMVNAVLAALLVVRRRPDVIFASSPPLPVLCAAYAVSRVTRRPFVADIRDIWPAIGVALGEVRGNRAVRLAQRLERFLYRTARRITVVTEGFVDHVVAQGADPEKVTFLPNGTVPELFSPDRTDPTLREELGEPRFVVGFFGNHGIAQGLPAVVDAASLLFDREDIHFLFVGEGPVKEELIAKARTENLSNVTFREQVPIEEVAEQIAACDMALVPLRRLETLETFVPSKLFDFLACATPVLLMVDGEARRILEKSGGGVYVEPEDARGLAEAVRRMADEPGQLAEMGRSGREYVLAHHSRHKQADRLEALLQQVADGGSALRQ
jgi:glycosyltransferase involved in cell wall biosynthesis